MVVELLFLLELMLIINGPLPGVVCAPNLDMTVLERCNQCTYLITTTAIEKRGDFYVWKIGTKKNKEKK